MTEPKVSIVIPAYNEEKYLADTLKAVCALDYKNFEVIVVNNASTDNTEKIARTFPVVVLNENKKGILFARECGRKNATGEIIANIDSDCQPDKDWLKKGVEFFKDPKVVALGGPYYYFDGSPFFQKYSSFIQKYFYYGMNKILNNLKRGGVLIGGNNMIRASVLNEIGGYDTNYLFYGEDTDTAKRVAQKGKVVFDKNFMIKTSARRFKAEGTIRISILYLFHFLKVAFFSRMRN
ncbi:MAG: glycosyltransferase family 2 protein [Candidatus Magasanikiibacteriota bacterium]